MTVPDAASPPDSAPAATDGPMSLAQGIALVVLAVLTLAALVPFVNHTRIYVDFPFSLDETEGYVLGQVHRLSSGGQLYGDPAELPYVVDNYPPAFPVIVNALEGMVGRSWTQGVMLPNSDAPPEDEASVGVKAAEFAHRFGVLRGLVVLLFSVMLLAMWRTWKSAGVSTLIAAASLVLFIAQPAVFFMFPLARADWGALCLGMIALACGWHGLHGDDSQRKWLWIALIPGVLALAFRQSAVMPLAAIGLTLLLTKDPRAGRWIGAGVIGVLLLGLALHLVYGAGIWTHLIDYTKTRYLVSRLGVTWGFLVRYSAFFLVLSGLAWWRLRRDPRWTLPVVYAPLALAMGLLSGKVGSDLNYFLEPLLGCAWVLGFGLQQLQHDASEETTIGNQLPVWMTAALCVTLLQSAVLQNPREGSYRPTRWDRANATELLLYLRSVEGPVLSEEEGIVALAGKEVWYNPFIMSELAREGLWDEAPLIEMVNRKAMPVVIVRELPNPEAAEDRGTGAGWDRFTPAMQRALAANYRAVMGVPYRREWIVMVPTE